VTVDYAAEQQSVDFGAWARKHRMGVCSDEERGGSSLWPQARSTRMWGVNRNK
jgi:hypothetical protein